MGRISSRATCRSRTSTSSPTSGANLSTGAKETRSRIRPSTRCAAAGNRRRSRSAMGRTSAWASTGPRPRAASRTSGRPITIEGPTMLFDDDEKLCAFARFCDPHGKVGNLVQDSAPRAATRGVQEAGHCPGGRLVAKHRATGEAFEPHLEPSIGLVQDTAGGISGPLWVRGGHPPSPRRGRAHVRSAQSKSGSVPVWRVEQQAVLRRLARVDQVQGQRVAERGRALPLFELPDLFV